MNLFWCGCLPENDESTQACPNKKLVIPSRQDVNDTDINKEGFKALMLSFASRARKNAQCFILDTRAVNVIPATYTLDKQFQTFIVKPSESNAIEIPITKIETVMGYEELCKHEDTNHWLVDPLIKSLSTDELNRFVLLEHWDNDGIKLERLCLVEGNDLTTSDMFITCIRILKLHNNP